MPCWQSLSIVGRQRLLRAKSLRLQEVPETVLMLNGGISVFS
jgi:hypothetical protein